MTVPERDNPYAFSVEHLCADGKIHGARYDITYAFNALGVLRHHSEKAVARYLRDFCSADDTFGIDDAFVFRHRDLGLSVKVAAYDWFNLLDSRLEAAFLKRLLTTWDVDRKLLSYAAFMLDAPPETLRDYVVRHELRPIIELPCEIERNVTLKREPVRLSVFFDELASGQRFLLSFIHEGDWRFKENSQMLMHLFYPVEASVTVEAMAERVFAEGVSTMAALATPKGANAMLDGLSLEIKKSLLENRQHMNRHVRDWVPAYLERTLLSRHSSDCLESSVAL